MYWRQESWDFKVTFGYIVSLRPDLATSVCWFICILIFTKPRVTQEERIEELPLSYWPVVMYMGNYLDW